MSKRKIGTTIQGSASLRHVISYLVSHSMSFEVEPLPDDEYVVRWKEGETLTVVKVQQIAIAPDPVAWWAAAATPQGELIKWGYDGDTKLPFYTQADAIAQLRYLMEHESHSDDSFYLLHVYADGSIFTEEWLTDDVNRPES